MDFLKDIVNKYINSGLIGLLMMFTINYHYTKDQSFKVNEYDAQETIVKNKLNKIAREAGILEKALEGYNIDTTALNKILHYQPSDSIPKEELYAANTLLKSKSKELYDQIVLFQEGVEELKDEEVERSRLEEDVKSYYEGINMIAIWIKIGWWLSSGLLGVGIYIFLRNALLDYIVDYFTKSTT